MRRAAADDGHAGWVALSHGGRPGRPPTRPSAAAPPPLPPPSPALQDGSEYWVMAANLKRIFEEKFAKAIKDDEGMWMSV